MRFQVERIGTEAASTVYLKEVRRSPKINVKPFPIIEAEWSGVHKGGNCIPKKLGRLLDWFNRCIIGKGST
jgi:hypothetical protein